MRVSCELVNPLVFGEGKNDNIFIIRLHVLRVLRFVISCLGLATVRLENVRSRDERLVTGESSRVSNNTS